jgi:hypothetical protein
MKTPTTLAAVAALIAGISVASAQNAGGNSSPTGSPSNINKGMNTGTPMSGQSGTESGGTAMRSGGSAKMVGNGQFCMEISKGGSFQCNYASLSACEMDAQARGLQCQERAATTGSK